MVDKNSTLMIIIISIPLLALYLLLGLGMVERRFLRRWEKPIIDIRDAALVTIGLDLAQMTSICLHVQNIGSKREILLTAVLLFLHLSALFLNTFGERIVIEEKTYARSTAFNRLLHMYIATILLLTNAVTINLLVGML